MEAISAPVAGSLEQVILLLRAGLAMPHNGFTVAEDVLEVWG